MLKSILLFNILLLFFLSFCFQQSFAQTAFIKSYNGQFLLKEKPYYYIGSNYWYAGLLGNSEEGKLRLQQELDFLNAQGVNNIRVMAGVEGVGLINGVQRVTPALQTSQGKFNEDQLNGLDYLLFEMGKRNGRC